MSKQINERCITNYMHACIYIWSGMNFIAGSVIVHCYFEQINNDCIESLEEKERRACILFCHLLSRQHVIEMFRDSNVLNRELKKLDFILRRYAPTALAVRHLISHDFSVHYWAMEWFVTCCSVGVSRELTLYVMNMLLTEEIDVLIRLGVAVMSILQSKIIKLTGSCLFI